jgi:hypothetical protein
VAIIDPAPASSRQLRIVVTHAWFSATKQSWKAHVRCL